MKYEIRIASSAEREIDKLPTSIHTRIAKKILSLEYNPRPRVTKKLIGRNEYRLPVGDYRILYTIEDKKHVITAFAVGHRREVYR